MNKHLLNSMTTLRRKASKRLQLISTNARRLISANKRWLISVAAGAVIGGIIGGIIEASDYAVFLADLHYHGVDPFEFGDFGYMGAQTVAGAIAGGSAGAVGGIGGTIAGILSRINGFGSFGSARARKIVIRVAVAGVIVAVAACIACVALAAFGVTAFSIAAPLGAGVLAYMLAGILVSTWSVAAGFVVGATRTDN